MMDALQWFGFIGTVVGYAVFTKSRTWGASLSLIGVVALGLWAFVLAAWGLLALELAFVAINLWVLWQEFK